MTFDVVSVLAGRGLRGVSQTFPGVLVSLRWRTNR